MLGWYSAGVLVGCHRLSGGLELSSTDVMVLIENKARLLSQGSEFAYARCTARACLASEQRWYELNYVRSGRREARTSGQKKAHKHHKSF